MPSSEGSRLGRLLQQECLAAIQCLAAAGTDAHSQVHAARKAIRRARSLLALANGGHDPGGADGILRRVGDSLGGLRDARVVALAAGRLGQRSGDGRWVHASEVLALRADRMARRELAADPGFAGRRRAIRRAARLLQSPSWLALGGADIRKALDRQGRRTRKAARRAAEDPAPENLHRWRRRVRRLRMQLDALDALGIPAPGHDASMPERLHALSDELGEHQDLEVLAATLRRMRSLDDRRELLQQLQRTGVTRPGRTIPRSRSGTSRQSQHIG